MKPALAGAALSMVVALGGADAPAALTIGGPGGVVRNEDMAALSHLGPMVSAEFREKDGRVATYAGPALFAVLDGAHAIPADMRGRAHETVTVTGSDGYAAVLALAEIDPGFEGKQVVLATTADGKMLARTRVIVPGDRAHSRDVRDVVSIVVR